MNNIRPSFLILGAQKAGTSALFNYLSKHPEVLPPKEKEINFFWQDHLFSKGIEWYEKQFPNLTKEEANCCQTFEATPHYLHSLKTVKRIYTYKKDMKFIVLLREPLSRAWSQFHMYQTKRIDSEGIKNRIEKYSDPVKSFFKQLQNPDYFVDFDAALLEERKAWNDDKTKLQPGLFWQGLYALHLQSYFSFFDRQQFFLIESEELKQHPALILKQLEDFLGLSSFDWANMLFPPINAGTYTSSYNKTLKSLFHLANSELYHLIGKKYHW